MTTAEGLTPTPTPASGTAHLAEGRRRRRRSDTLRGWIYCSPFLLAFGLFLIWPIVYGLWMSFTGTSLAGTNTEFVGLANWIEALGDPNVWSSLGNTAWFTILSTIPLVLVALIPAVLVNIGLPGQWFWRLSFFMPFLLYLAALQNIPEQLYEAASLDGAGRWRQFVSITVPQLAPTTVLVLVLQLLASLKVFDQIYQMTGGGPGGSTRPVLLYIYEVGFTGYRLGYASAISYIFFFLIILISIAYMVISSRRSVKA